MKFMFFQSTAAIMSEWIFPYNTLKTECSDFEKMDNLESNHHQSVLSLFSAAKKGNLKQVAFLLKLGKDPSRTDSSGISPLHIAIWKNHCHVVQKLVKHSSDIDIPDKNGDTALIKAVKKKCSKCTSCLLASGASVNRANTLGNTALFVSCELGFGDIAMMLLKAGAKVNSRNTKKETALHAAVSYGHLACVKMLLEAKADVDLPDYNGATPLSVAAGFLNGPNSSTQHILKLLLENNADLNVKAKRSEISKTLYLTPIEIAICKRRTETAIVLYHAGSDLSRIHKWQRTHKRTLAACKDVLHTFGTIDKEPRTLTDICRIKLRDEIRGICKPEQLPLPKMIQDIVKLKDI